VYLTIFSCLKNLDCVQILTCPVFEAKFMLPWSFSEGSRRRKIHASAAA